MHGELDHAHDDQHDIEPMHFHERSIYKSLPYSDDPTRSQDRKQQHQQQIQSQQQAQQQ